MAWLALAVGCWCLFWSLSLLTAFGLTLQVFELVVGSTALTMAGLQEVGL